MHRFHWLGALDTRLAGFDCDNFEISFVRKGSTGNENAHSGKQKNPETKIVSLLMHRGDPSGGERRVPRLYHSMDHPKRIVRLGQVGAEHRKCSTTRYDHEHLC